MPLWLKRSLLAIWRRLPDRLQGWASWLLLPKHLIGAMAVVFDAEGRVLLFRHTYRDDYPWGLPGGWLKGGEDPMRAIEREVMEEGGYRIHTQYPIVIGGDRDLRRLDLIFLCDLVGGSFRRSPEVSDAGFFALDELPGRVEPFHVEVVAYAGDVIRDATRAQPPRAPRLRTRGSSAPVGRRSGDGSGI